MVRKLHMDANLSFKFDTFTTKLFLLHTGESIELSVLIGQNFYSQISKIESISKFYLYIDPQAKSTEEIVCILFIVIKS